MATSDPRPRLRKLVRGSAAAMILMAIGIIGCGPPDLGVDKDAFKAVDALYTAVSLRDMGLVERCEATLKTLSEEGKLPAGASKSLSAIIARAKAGEWEPAQDDLTRFMEAQRK